MERSCAWVFTHDRVPHKVTPRLFFSRGVHRAPVWHGAAAPAIAYLQRNLQFLPDLARILLTIHGASRTSRFGCKAHHRPRIRMLIIAACGHFFGRYSTAEARDLIRGRCPSCRKIRHRRRAMIQHNALRRSPSIHHGLSTWYGTNPFAASQFPTGRHETVRRWVH